MAKNRLVRFILNLALSGTFIDHIKNFISLKFHPSSAIR